MSKHRSRVFNTFTPVPIERKRRYFTPSNQKQYKQNLDSLNELIRKKKRGGLSFFEISEHLKRENIPHPQDTIWSENWVKEIHARDNKKRAKKAFKARQRAINAPSKLKQSD